MNAQANQHIENIIQEPISISDFIETMVDSIVDETQKAYHCETQRVLDVLIAAAWNKRKQLSGTASVANGGRKGGAGGAWREKLYPDGAVPNVPASANLFSNGVARTPHRTTDSARTASSMHTASFLQTYMLRGKVLGDITMSELIVMEGETQIELRLIKMLRNHAANVAGYDTVSDVLNDETAMEYVKRAISGEDDE